MPGRKAPRGRNTFDIGEQQDAGRERKQLVEFQQPEGRHGKAWQALRDFAGDGNAERRQAKQRCDNNRQDNDGKSDRPARQQAFAEQ